MSYERAQWRCFRSSSLSLDGGASSEWVIERESHPECRSSIREKKSLHGEKKFYRKNPPLLLKTITNTFDLHVDLLLIGQLTVRPSSSGHPMAIEHNGQTTYKESQPLQNNLNTQVICLSSWRRGSMFFIVGYKWVCSQMFSNASKCSQR